MSLESPAMDFDAAQSHPVPPDSVDLEVAERRIPAADHAADAHREAQQESVLIEEHSHDHSRSPKRPYVRSNVTPVTFTPATAESLVPHVPDTNPTIPTHLQPF